MVADAGARSVATLAPAASIFAPFLALVALAPLEALLDALVGTGPWRRAGVPLRTVVLVGVADGISRIVVSVVAPPLRGGVGFLGVGGRVVERVAVIVDDCIGRGW